MKDCIFILTEITLVILAVHFIPLAKGEESIWAFFLGSIATALSNFKCAYFLMQLFYSDTGRFFYATYFLLFFLGFLSIEEIVIGIVSRLIWTHQRESFCMVKNSKDMAEEEKVKEELNELELWEVRQREMKWHRLLKL